MATKNPPQAQLMQTPHSLDIRPSTAIVAAAAGDGLPRYVTRDQARQIINAAETIRHRLLLEALWQSGGRISEVLRLRPCDVDQDEGALRLLNLKQRKRALRTKLVYVSPELVGDLKRFATDARIPMHGFYFCSRQSGLKPMSRGNAWLIINGAARRAGVCVITGDGPSFATARDFRHGAGIHQIRQGVPVSEVQQQLGHARLDTTAVYLKLANPERRPIADRVDW